MDLDLTDDQQLLVDTASHFIAEHSPVTRLRQLIADNRWLDAQDTARRAELGWYAAFVDEKYGGGSVSGRPAADAAAVAEVRGRALQPEPFIGVNAAAAVLQAAGRDDQRQELLPPMADGSGLVTIATAGDAAWGGRCRATPTPEGWLLDAPRVVVADVPVLRHILVGAEVADPADGTGTGAVAQVRYFIVPVAAGGVAASSAETLDLTQPMRMLALRRVRVSAAQLVDDDESVARGTSVATALAVAETVGAMTRLLEMTRDYAQQRVAFGRPIGSFQAIKHLLADLSVVAESAESLSAAAARAADDNAGYAAEVASIAKLYLGEHSVPFAEDCLQVFGGIGFTWEHDLHLYLRRLAANTALYGTTDWHRDRILAARAHETGELA
jgi:alkylation response protein AidB-like acyl-CoA dehydrogenase